MYEPGQDVPATVDSWHHGGIGQTRNKKCISVTTHNFNVGHISFTGPACEPKEASKQLCGTINEAFGTFHLSEITFMQEKVISPNFGVFTLR